MFKFVALTVLILGAATSGRAVSSPPVLVRTDLNGDGAPETVELVQTRGSVSLKVRPGNSTAPAQALDFGVDPARQDAICGLPAKLDVVSLVCAPMDEPLAGCKPGNGAKALLLSGGECDAIHLYWDHDAGKLAWWRL